MTFGFGQGFNGDSSGDGNGLQSAPPGSGFTWANAPAIIDTGTTFRTSFDIDAQRPVTELDLWVDKAAVDDSGLGTEASPKKHLKSAVALMNAAGVPAHIRIKGGPIPYHGAEAWDGIVPTQDFILEPWGDPEAWANRVFLVRAPAISATWFPDSGIYRSDSFFLTAPYAVFDTEGTDADVAAFPYSSILVGSEALCIAMPGSHWHDPATFRLHVHAFNSRSLIGSRSIVVLTTGGGNNFRFACTTSVTMWLQNICFIDGSNNVWVQSGAAGLNIRVYMKDAAAIGSVLGDGMSFLSTHADTVIEVYLTRCGTGLNVMDGFDYRSDPAAPGAMVYFFEQDPVTKRNGFDGSGANNASTAHGTAQGITLNSDFAGSQDRVINDIDNTVRLVYGGIVRASAGAGASAKTVQAAADTGTHTSKIYLNRCIVEESASGGLNAAAGCYLGYRNMDVSGLSIGGAGTVEEY